MGGGLMQLVAYGAQDIYLTGNPQITFFKVVYRRHTNFAMESIEQVFSGNVNLGKKTSCTIARNGDLLGKMYLEADVKLKTGVSTLTDKRVGHKIIDYIEVEIGGQCIDKHYGEWLDLWSQLTCCKDGFEKLERLVDGTLEKGGVKKLYIPLQFWFNRNPGLALPLIALQYHEVKLNVQFAKSSEVSLENVCLFCDYIFLDTDERRRFAQVSHEYLIEQVQFNGKNYYSANETCANIELRFNHPCKELVFVAQDKSKEGTFNYSGAGDADNVDRAVLELNGHDRFREREGSYFRCVQTLQHHTGGFDHDGDKEKGFIYVYSFALKPEEHQPSGTCNFSRIDNALLTLSLSEASAARLTRVYATNYNVLRIMSGMGGLAYSN